MSPRPSLESLGDQELNARLAKLKRLTVEEWVSVLKSLMREDVENECIFKRTPLQPTLLKTYPKLNVAIRLSLDTREFDEIVPASTFFSNELRPASTKKNLAGAFKRILAELRTTEKDARNLIEQFISFGAIVGGVLDRRQVRSITVKSQHRSIPRR